MDYNFKMEVRKPPSTFLVGLEKSKIMVIIEIGIHMGN